MKINNFLVNNKINQSGFNILNSSELEENSKILHMFMNNHLFHNVIIKNCGNKYFLITNIK